MRVLLFKFIIQVTSLLSLKTAHKWAHAVSKLIWRTSEKQRRITTKNIQMCFPHISNDEQIQLAQSSLSETIKSMFELGIIWKKYKGNIEPLIQNIHGLDVFEQALAKNQGMLMAAPHFGNWEVLNFWLSKYPGFAFLYKPPSEPKIETLLLKYRGASGAQQITANAKGVRQVFKVLKDKKILAILPDQQPKNGQGLFAPFMGQPAYTMTLFSKIAAKTRVPVVFAVAERLNNGAGFDLHFKTTPNGIYADVQSSVETINQVIGSIAEINPSQYQWTYRRFSIQEDGSRPYQKT